MTRLADQLARAVGVVEPTFDLDDVHRRVRARRTRRVAGRGVVLIGVLALAVGAIAVAARPDGAKKIRTVTTSAPTPSHAVFSEVTGTTLLFDDGYDGIVAVDLDHGVVTRRVIEGQRAGDQPYRLLRVGDSLIVGWGEIWAAPLSGAPPHKLGDATIAVPAVEDNSVWLVNWPGGYIGGGEPTLRLVGLDGSEVQEPGPAPRGGVPQVGVPTGVAVATSQGLDFWGPGNYPALRALLEPAGGLGRALAAHDLLMAWCDAAPMTHITNLNNAHDVTVPLPGQCGEHAEFSPDGRSLAVATQHGIVIGDVQTGAATVAFAGEQFGEVPDVGWSRDGTQLFASSYSYGKHETVLGRYDLETATAETVTVPIGGVLSFVTAANEEARAFVDGTPSTSNECVPPTIQPSGRTAACSFPLPR